MKYGITTSKNKIHLFTDDNECFCDLNIKIKKEVSNEYALLYSNKLCKNCNCIYLKNLKINNGNKNESSKIST